MQETRSEGELSTFRDAIMPSGMSCNIRIVFTIN
jgi:hypothetical protein